ncbi:LysM peptidoglycan-binding domain-containing protein [Sphingorhabdus wooponensis]|uniref:LysM peptidoglycan-binding domain-containing protein n=1 Tax=Sphingorhabdus wooponensis TaxID=940136 RepID=A0A426RSE3_9SPHN|nr:LysM peptidoglycan-binding domain-containing protein [Sphingorhabdus wooponensis]RRQ51836.1 LysM peptidoglycan-binding domain-containing protein [Sphingorhabdus wooponensis]
MAETIISKLPIEEASGNGGFIGPRMKVAISWVRAFGLLAVVILAGATAFKDAVATSIASTPHPELVYAIFAVAFIAAVLLAILLHDFLKEQAWFDTLRSSAAEDQDIMIASIPRTGSMAYFYRVYMQTRGMPLAIRQPAMEDEMSSVESQMFARLSLPNLLSGSLVGLGLVGTFIGLLQTLDELSGVFAALGGGSGSDSGAMFSTMIVKLQGPMQGMGTAFVASLYGLLGSLIIGLTVSSVKSAGERLFRDVREFLNEELYPSGGASMVAWPATATAIDAAPRGGFTPEQTAELHAMISQEHKAMRDLFIHWEQSFSRRFDQLANVATHINHQLVDAVNAAGAQAERHAEQLKLVSEAEGRLATAIDDKGGRFVDQLDSLRKDLSVAQHGVFPVFGRLALAFAVVGALAGLAAAALSLSSGSAATAPNAPPAAVVAPAAVAPASGSAPAADAASNAPSNANEALEQVIVAEGQSLSLIALDRGIPLEAMIAANPQLADPTLLFPGDKVNLPKAGSAPAE